MCLKTKTFQIKWNKKSYEILLWSQIGIGQVVNYKDLQMFWCNCSWTVDWITLGWNGYKLLAYCFSYIASFYVIIFAINIYFRFDLWPCSDLEIKIINYNKYWEAIMTSFIRKFKIPQPTKSGNTLEEHLWINNTVETMFHQRAKTRFVSQVVNRILVARCPNYYSKIATKM